MSCYKNILLFLCAHSIMLAGPDQEDPTLINTQLKQYYITEKRIPRVKNKKSNTSILANRLLNALEENNINAIQNVIKDGIRICDIIVYDLHDAYSVSYPILAFAKSTEAFYYLIANDTRNHNEIINDPVEWVYNKEKNYTCNKIAHPLDFQQVSLLQYFIIEQKPEIVQAIIRLGTNVNNSINGYPPLLYAAEYCPEVFAFLVAQGADLYKKNRDGQTIGQWIKNRKKNGQNIDSTLITTLKKYYDQYPKAKEKIARWLKENNFNTSSE